MSKITLNDIYYLTCVLLNNKISNEIWVSNTVYENLKPALDKAMEQGAKIFFSQQDVKPQERQVIVGGFTFIEKPDINGIMCFGNPSFSFNEKDTDFKEFLLLIEPYKDREVKRKQSK